MGRTTLTIPEDLREQAKALDINISEVCRYALEAAIPAVKAARKAGDEFEPVTFTLIDSLYEIEELVQFTGKMILDDHPIYTYLTPKAKIVVLYNEGDGPLREHDDFTIYNDLGSFRRDVTSHADFDGRRHLALQVAEQALGQAPTPRMLDI